MVAVGIDDLELSRPPAARENTAGTDPTGQQPLPQGVQIVAPEPNERHRRRRDAGGRLFEHDDDAVVLELNPSVGHEADLAAELPVEVQGAGDEGNERV